MLNVAEIDGQEIVFGDNRLLPINDLRMATADMEFDFSVLELDDIIEDIDPETAELTAFDSKRFLLKLDRIEDNIKNSRSWNDGIRFNLCVGLAPQDDLQIVLYFYYTRDEETRKKVYSLIESFIRKCGNFDFNPYEYGIEDIKQEEITTVKAYRLLYAFEKKAYETGEDQYYEKNNQQKMLKYERYIKD